MHVISRTLVAQLIHQSVEGRAYYDYDGEAGRGEGRVRGRGEECMKTIVQCTMDPTAIGREGGRER